MDNKHHDAILATNLSQLSALGQRLAMVEREKQEIIDARMYSEAKLMEALDWETSLKVAALERHEAMTLRAKRLADLLREWRQTPFFEDEDAWRAWVDKFGARVDEALKEEA